MTYFHSGIANLKTVDHCQSFGQYCPTNPTIVAQCQLALIRSSFKPAAQGSHNLALVNSALIPQLNGSPTLRHCGSDRWHFSDKKSKKKLEKKWNLLHHFIFEVVTCASIIYGWFLFDSPSATSSVHSFKTSLKSSRLLYAKEKNESEAIKTRKRRSRNFHIITFAKTQLKHRITSISEPMFLHLERQVHIQLKPRHDVTSIITETIFSFFIDIHSEKTFLLQQFFKLLSSISNANKFKLTGRSNSAKMTKTNRKYPIMSAV